MFIGSCDAIGGPVSSASSTTSSAEIFTNTTKDNWIPTLTRNNAGFGGHGCYVSSTGFHSITPAGTAGNINGVGAAGGKGYSYEWNEGSSACGGGGGAGYGAGGGAGGYTSGKYDTSSNWPTIYGGGSGKIVKTTINLTSTSSIAVTVGAGGAGTVVNSSNGWSGSGAPGCVCVFW